MLRALNVKPNANVATAKLIVHHSAANNVKKTVIANAVATATTVTASVSANALTVRISRVRAHQQKTCLWGQNPYRQAFLFY
jgi:hypothetical protein